MAELTGNAPYVIADPGRGVVWHIPRAPGDDRPLCGAELARPRRRYLPSGLGAGDVVCPECLRLQRAGLGANITQEELTELIQAARGFLHAVDHITTEAFALGAERIERERLRAILARVLGVSEEDIYTPAARLPSLPEKDAE